MKSTMKKFISMLLAMVLLFGSVAVGGEGVAEWLNAFSVKVSAASEEDVFVEGDFIFALNEEGTGYLMANNNEFLCGEVIIPSTIKGKPVLEIVQDAFWYCTGVTKLIVPDSIVTIGYNAFYYVNNVVYNGTASGSPWGAKCVNGYIEGDLVYSDSSKTMLCGFSRPIEGSVMVPESVISIARGAFRDCAGMTSVTIPNSITSIPDEVFSYCTGLTSVTIPNSVTSIGDSAFCGCTGLTSIIIPNSVTSIGYRAFDDCTGLISVTIPNSVTSIGDSAFEDCAGLTCITAPEAALSVGADAFNNTGYCNDGDNWADDVLYIGNHLIAAKKTISGSCTIKDGTVSIADDAFRLCSNLKSVTIPNSVIYFGDGAFDSAGCCEYDNGVYYVDKCLIKADRRILPGTYTVRDGTVTIANDAFRMCVGLTNIDLPSSLTRIGSGAFLDCLGLMSLSVPSSVTSIGEESFEHVNNVCYTGTALGSPWGAKCINGFIDDQNLVYSDSTMTELCGCSMQNDIISVPYEVKIIKDAAFYACSNLHRITFYATNLESVGDEAFLGCGNLESVSLPDSLKTIGEEAFAGCSALSDITIPSGVTSIGEQAFNGVVGVVYCYGTSVGAPWGANNCHLCGNCGEKVTYDFDFSSGHLYIVGTGEMQNYASESEQPWHQVADGIKSVIFDSIDSIGDFSFSGCTKLTSVTIPKCIISIGDYAFEGCTGLYNVNYSGTTEQWNDISIGVGNDCLTYAYLKILFHLTFELNDDGVNYSVSDCNRSATGALIIPSTYCGKPVTRIGAWAFFDCTGLTSVTIPDSVTSIGSSAFCWCDSLTSITIGNSVTSIEDWAFSGCTGLTSIIIPNSVTSIGENAFYGCTGLKTAGPIGGGYNIEFGWDSTIPNYAFEDFAGLTSIIIPDSLTSIGNSAFYGCTGLTSVTIGSDLASIGDFAFYGCTDLTSVTIPDSVKSIGFGAFACTGLMSVTIPNSVTFIGEQAFDGVYVVYFYGTDCGAPWGACRGCWLGTYGENINYSFEVVTGELTIWGTGAMPNYFYSQEDVFPFGQSVNLKSVVFYGDITSICDFAFYDCPNLSFVIFSNSLESIGYKAFCDCPNLTGVYLPDSLKIIGEHAFEHCTGLTSVILPYSLETIGRSAFYGCIGLSDITIPSGVTHIGEQAFSGVPIVYYEGDYCDIPSGAPWGAGNCYISGVCGENINYCFNIITQELTISGTGKMQDCTSNQPWGDFSSNIKTVRIEFGVTSIGAGAFEDCAALTCVEIANSVTSIGEFAFCCCSTLTRTDIPFGVKLIGDYAFYGCINLSQVNIPKSVISIGDKVFQKNSDVQYSSGATPHPGTEPIDEAIVYCYKDSVAHQYAESNGNSVVLIDDVCAVNGTLPVIENTNFIIGITSGAADFTKGFTLAEGYSMVAPSASTRVGTGDKIIIVDTEGFTVVTYEAVIFGDINGDSWYDGTDAYFVYLVANGLISPDSLTEAQRTACDANHDGVINADDAKLIEKAGVLLNQINQNATPEELSANSAYIEYCGLIDQTVELNEITPEAQPDSDSTAAAAPEPQPTAQSILGWFRMVFTIVLNWLTRIF